MLNHVDYMLYQTELYIKYESNMIVDYIWMLDCI